MYKFGPFRFWPKRQLLTHDGNPVRIGARALDILTLLLQHPGEVVTKEDLVNFVWPRMFVHEGNLKVNVASLRSALAEKEPHTVYIATVVGRGYRFVAAVEPDEASEGVLGASNGTTLPELPLVVGRLDDLPKIVDKLLSSRSVTVVGPGGVGKTTIAVVAAHQVAKHYKHGAHFVDFSTLGEPQYVPMAIASGLGVGVNVSDPISAVVTFLRDQNLLLILDNCEHLISAISSAVTRILDAAAGVSILATSREPLRTRLETVYRLPTLEVPDHTNDLNATNALAFSAVELFVARASERTGYAFKDSDVPAVASICRKLDGIPLAVELAASKMDAFDAETLLDKLEERFRVLSYGPRDAPLRQQTLLATLDWSYRLLSDEEATLLRYLSVFKGVFQLADAVAMSVAADLGGDCGIDTIERLVARSLVSAEYHDGSLRYRLLDTTRAYADERLIVAKEKPHALEHHARYVLALFERAEEEWSWRIKRNWLSIYAGRVDDLRKAIAWGYSPCGDPQLAIRADPAPLETGWRMAR
ncbi:winged helix-turn-helix domain-containing protein [Methylobacterium oxalidis]|uniref:winged helix-turn-helix domain-containing protein n=1 Tax=Methylobacterium oxalidis TaxID=944322 RepID=UPI00331637A1